ncbi:MAG: dihydropteroate synthase [Porticoccaceae bacterium]|jgi:dihydropteroate synthase
MSKLQPQTNRLKCGTKVLDLSNPAVMAVLNITPDSFSDGGQLFTNQHIDKAKVLSTVETMIEDGADIIDLGGESTRPGAQPVSTQQELDRVIPVLELLAANFDSIFSVDTSTPEVMQQAARSGAHLINDVRALQRPNALETAAQLDLPVCLMHMQNQPTNMQQNPQYKDVVTEVIEFLQQRKLQCNSAGIPSQQILLDPGFGFGKTLEHNLALFAGLPEIARQKQPIVVGVSRKSMIGQLINTEVNDRLIGSVTMGLLAAQKIYSVGGSMILRVHDVKETVQAIQIWQATKNYKGLITNEA